MPSNQKRAVSNVYNNSRSFSMFSQTLTGIKTQGDSHQTEALGSDDHRILSRSQIITDIYERQALKSASQGLLLLAEGWDEVRSYSGVRRTNGITSATHRANVTTLPLEILLEIFDLMFVGEGEYAIIEASVMISFLSSVCRRFREVILMFPRVWGYMNIGWLGEEGVKRHLTRSKKMPLYIQFDYTNRVEQALLQALEHKDRWAYLRCYFVSRNWKILGSAPSVVFPSMRTLRVYVGHDLGGRRCDDLFSAWSFPNIRDLVLQDHIPKSGIFDHSTGSLTTLRYSAELAKYRSDGTFLTSLVGLLGPASSLRTLELDVSQLTAGLAADEPEEALLLPSVTHFTLTSLNRKQSCQDRPLTWEDISSILYVLHMPNVEKLSVSMLITYDHNFDIEDWLFISLPPSERELERLSDFEFTLRWWGIQRIWEGRPDIPLHKLFWIFPSLENLSLDAEECTHSFEPDMLLELDELRSLRIMDWNCKTELHEVLRDMKGCGAEPREIYIHSKKRAIDRENLGSVFSDAKITVIAPSCKRRNTGDS